MSDMAEEAQQCLNSHLARWHACRKQQFDAEQPRSLQLMEITCVLQNWLAFLAPYSHLILLIKYHKDKNAAVHQCSVKILNLGGLLLTKQTSLNQNIDWDLMWPTCVVAKYIHRSDKLKLQNHSFLWHVLMYIITAWLGWTSARFTWFLQVFMLLFRRPLIGWGKGNQCSLSVNFNVAPISFRLWLRW